MSRPVSIRGTREGLTVTLGPGDTAEILKQLSQHLAERGAFFRGGMVALEVEDRSLSVDELTSIQQLLSTHDMVLRTVVTADQETQAAAQALGLRLVGPPSPSPEAAPEARTAPRVMAVAVESPPTGSRGILVHRKVRSGQVIRHTGHIVVVGDVNAGAEIVAGGDIVIWGKLMGTAHAGAMGDESAIVCALEFSPLQLRIGRLIARPADGDRMTRRPEVACVRENMIVVEDWDQTHRGG